MLLAVVGALISSALPASAHNVLISSNPAAGSVLAHAPNSITLVFDQDVENVYAEMAVTIGSQPPVDFTPQIDGPDVTADLAAQHLTVPAASQASGQTPWKIGYRIVSADGHPVSGLVDFAVGTAGPVGTSAATKAVASQEDHAWRIPAWLVIASITALLVLAVALAAILLRRRRRTAT